MTQISTGKVKVGRLCPRTITRKPRKGAAVITAIVGSSKAPWP